jgi:hypothetical protein
VEVVNHDAMSFALRFRGDAGVNGPTANAGRGDSVFACHFLVPPVGLEPTLCGF